MPLPKKIRCLFIFSIFIVGIMINCTMALTMQFMVTMPPVITKSILTEFDIFGTGIGAPVFYIGLSNAGDPNTYPGLTLTYLVEYIPANSTGNGKKTIYKGISRIFSMDPDENVPPISSTDFLQVNNMTVKTSIERTLEELPDTDPLKQKFLDTQKIPDGRVVYTMILSGGMVNENQSSIHTVINTYNIDPLAPGAKPTDFPITVYEAHPLFIWMSDIPPHIYGTDDVFEIKIYKAKSGESAASAMSRQPVMKGGTAGLQFRYPENGHQLTPGAVYFWEVIGIIKGSTTSKIRSQPFKFVKSKISNPKVLEVINILRQYPEQYNDALLEKIADFDADVIIRIDNKTVEIEELRTLIQEFIQDKYSVINTNVE